ISQFVQIVQSDYDQVAMETTLLWLLLAESLVLPHLLWVLSGRYRHAVRYLWRVYILRDATAREEDAAACTLQAYRMKAKETSVHLYNNGSATQQLNGNASRATKSESDISTAQGPSGNQRDRGDHTVVKMASTATSTSTSAMKTSTTDLDDGMVAVASLPSRTDAVPLKYLSQYAKVKTSNDIPAQKTDVEEIKPVVTEQTTESVVGGEFGLYDIVHDEVYENKQMSSPGVWASRIEPKKGFESAGGGVTSHSTPNTPTKSSLGVSPNPPSRKAGSTSSSGSSSYSRVKRSASATSRQEWKERMRKKHLPAIFINSSFEEDNAQSPSDAQSISAQSSTSAQTHSYENVNEMNSKDVPLIAQTLEKNESANVSVSKKSYVAPSVPKNPSTESMHYVTSANYVETLNSLPTPVLNKQSTMESEGISGMYEDGDIKDVLDSSVALESITHDKTMGQSQKKSSVSSDSVHLKENLMQPPPFSSKELKSHQANPKTEKIHLIKHVIQGVDNYAFEFGTEERLPGTVQSDIFYDDTVVSPFTQETSLSSPTASPPVGLDHSSGGTPVDKTIFEVSPGNGNKSASSEGDLHAKSTLSTLSEAFVSSEPQLVPNTTAVDATPTSFVNTSAPIPLHSRRAKYRQMLASSDLIVSSVDEPNDDPQTDVATHENSLNNETGTGQTNEKDTDHAHAANHVEGLSSDGGQSNSGTWKTAGGPDQETVTPELNNVSQDWNQLETVSGSEMLFLKTKSVRTAAEVILESSIEEDEEDEDRKEKEEKAAEGDEVDALSNGGSRVNEEEWQKLPPANLASFSTRENLNEVGQIDYNITSRSSSPDSSPPPFERDGNGDGAESVPDLLHGTVSKSLPPEDLEKDTRDPEINTEPTRNLPNLKDFRTNNTSGKNPFLRESFEILSDSPEYKHYIAQNAKGKNPFFVSQDSYSDSVFESSIETSKDLSPERSPSVAQDEVSGKEVLKSEKQDTNDGINEKLPRDGQPRDVYDEFSSVPKPLPSLTPTLSPILKRPVRNRKGKQGGEEVYARLTSSEDELDGIFDDDGTRYNDPGVELNTYPSIHDTHQADYGLTVNNEKVHAASLKNSSSDNLNPWDSIAQTVEEKNTVSIDIQSDDRQVDLTESLESHSSVESDTSEHSVVLEPYGERRPQWLDDDDLSFNGNTSQWGKSGADFISQDVYHAPMRRNISSGKENIIYIHRPHPYESSTDFDAANEEISQASTDFRFTGTGETATVSSAQYPSYTTNPQHRAQLEDYATNPQHGAQLEEYDFDSVNIASNNPITTPRYQKNPRPSSSRPSRTYNQVQSNLSQNTHNPLPPPYSATHRYQPPDIQLSQHHQLVQYHFDEDIDRGFEDALSMDYLPLAAPPLPSHMNTLYTPGTSLGLYFESITEEPEDSLSLTELAEASSLNGDSIFKTQAVISRPSSRASFATSTDNQQPDSSPRLDNKYSKTFEESDPLKVEKNSSKSTPGSDSSSNSPDLRHPSHSIIDDVPSYERTSADGSEAETPSGNGNHHSSPSKSSVITHSGNPWEFSEFSVDFNKISSENALDLDPNNQKNSPWLEIDVTVGGETNADQEQQLDMSFESDFSSDNALTDDLDKDGSQTFANVDVYKLKSSSSPVQGINELEPKGNGPFLALTDKHNNVQLAEHNHSTASAYF
ncbi:hypothetical protein PoB_004275200, partial [Plakobranchus ocellatus]